MVSSSEMLTKLRAQMAQLGLDGLVIWRADMFSGEEVRACDERLAKVTGFTGSAGYGLILHDHAFVFSDGRYHLQMETQLSADDFGWRDSSPTALADVLAEIFGDHACDVSIGFDALTTTVSQKQTLPEAAGQARIIWQSLAHNLVDQIWDDRQVADQKPAWPLPDEIAGRTTADKLSDLQQTLQAQGCDGIIISAVDCVNWLINIRGTDLATTPFHLCFAFVPQVGPVMIIEGRVSDYECQSWQDFSSNLGPGHYQIDPKTLPVALYDALQRPGLTFTQTPCPVYMSKACKNDVELAGFAQAHVRDALAVVRFWHWMAHCKTITSYSETDLVAKLKQERAKDPSYLCDSFETIMGSGPNGAIIHYRAMAGSDSLIADNTLLLIDSGGHYQMGTTDITRTFAIGTADEEAISAYSAVLAAHIALARAVFPQGTTGAALDAICRAPLWQTGRDYAHGTGHGVGHVLNVHEGPAHISKRAGPALMAGMVLSNEPGFYQQGKWGIRLENLITITQNDDGFMGSKSLTLVPFERALIDPKLLNDEAIAWLDWYHAHVYDTLSAHIDDAALKGWLAELCAPLKSG